METPTKRYSTPGHAFDEEESAMSSTATKADHERLRRRLSLGAFCLVASLLIAFAVVSSYKAGQETRPTAMSGGALGAVSGQGSNSLPPWPLPADVPARVDAAGLNLGAMGMAEHYHAHLDILIDGMPSPVSPNLGVDPLSGAMSAVHTHAGDGIIHIEAGTKGQPYTLGQLFTEWDVQLSSDKIGSLTSGGTKSISAYVNGKRFAGNPALIRLSEHQQIALVYGTAADQIKVPTNFTFDKGL